jgi:hypothetical protein
MFATVVRIFDGPGPRQAMKIMSNSTSLIKTRRFASLLQLKLHFCTAQLRTAISSNGEHALGLAGTNLVGARFELEFGSHGLTRWYTTPIKGFGSRVVIFFFPSWGPFHAQYEVVVTMTI